MTGALLTLNAGSSSLKFAVFAPDAPATQPTIAGKVSGIGTAPVFTAYDASGTQLDKGPLAQLDAQTSHDQIIAALLPWLDCHQTKAPLGAVGHRVVHGGTDFAQPTLVSPPVLAALDRLVPLAPLHQPHNLAAIRAVAKWRPDVPQIACFDTSFHRSQPRLAQLFALPRALADEGVLRYGFHGLSYDFIASILPEHLGAAAEGRVIVAHLGNGASLCALKNRQSVATSMGFTAVDGLMMGTRCGTLDPGVLLYLMQSKGMDAAGIEDLLYCQSGLLGVSGLSSDLHVLENSDAASAEEAVDLFCYRAASLMSGLVPALGGLDAVVFTAGIGENSARVRAAICDRLDWLGVMLDPAANGTNARQISTPQSRVSVLVLPTNEEATVAKACRAVLTV
jgi:acetate kinase